MESILSSVKEYIIHAKESKSEIRHSEMNYSVEEKNLKLKKESEESTQKQ